MAQDELSEGLNEDDPMIVDEEMRIQVEDDSSESANDDEYMPQWEDVPQDWQPNWLGPYQLNPGPSSEFPPNIREVSQYFSLFYDTEVLNLLVEETNRYASQFFEEHQNQANSSYYKDWTPCDAVKIKAYLGLIIHMGLSQYPRFEHHWSTSPLYGCSLCPNIMQKKDFFLIHSFFHFSDNRTANLEDKLYKIRRLFELLSSRFCKFYVPHRELSLDERIVKYSGRLSFLQFIRNKPNQFGIKVFVLADAPTGYVYNWKVYTGAEARENEQRRNQNDRSQSQQALFRTIVELTNNVVNRNHVIAFDSYYAYLNIVRYLTRRNIGCVATLDSRRRLIPIEIKKPRRTMQPQEAYFQKDQNVMTMVFKDKRFVRIISSIHGRQLDQNNRPIALRDYNNWARGVDLSNQLVSSYHHGHKSVKWYKILALNFLETSIANAYILYKHQNPFTAHKHLKFREALVIELLQDYINQRIIQIQARQVERIILGQHHIGKRDQRNCAVCSTKTARITTIYYCQECNVNVCPVNCFYRLHTVLTLHSRIKSRNM